MGKCRFCLASYAGDTRIYECTSATGIARFEFCGDSCANDWARTAPDQRATFDERASKIAAFHAMATTGVHDPRFVVFGSSMGMQTTERATKTLVVDPKPKTMDDLWALVVEVREEVRALRESLKPTT